MERGNQGLGDNLVMADSVLIWGVQMTRMLLITAIAALCMVSTANAAMNRIEKSQQLKKIHLKMYLQGVRGFDERCPQQRHRNVREIEIEQCA